MKYADAIRYIRDNDGRNYEYLKQWGLGILNEAIRTVRSRKCSTKEDLEVTKYLENTILRGKYNL
jgi:hypothetical protein